MTAPSRATSDSAAPTLLADTTPGVGTVKIAKATKGRLKATVGTATRIVLKVTATTGRPTGKFSARLGGFKGKFRATLKATGRLVIRVPELAKVGRRALKVTYLGDDLHPGKARKFALRVVR